MAAIIRHRGNFKNIKRFLTEAKKLRFNNILERFGAEGVNALAMATRVDSGVTADSWGYYVEYHKGAFSLVWTNSNAPGGIPVAILIQYGHGTRNGGYVKGVDYINPAIAPIFDRLSNELWLEVTKL
ncbi:MAG: HK97 gp10 family phage protein [Eubacterium sp.]|jgi:hypothetical protein|nr:HK97 gp10 family phage protein [Eubacterium sp.]